MLMCALNFFQTTSAVVLILMMYTYLFGFDERRTKKLFYVFSGIAVIISTVLPIIIGVNEDADIIKEAILFIIFVFLPCFRFKHNKKLLIPVLGLLINATSDYVIFIFTTSFNIKSFYITAVMFCILYAVICVVLLTVKNRLNREIMKIFFDSISPVFYAVIILADISAYYDVIISTDSTYYVEVSNAIRILSTILIIGAVFYIVIKFSDSLHKQRESEMQLDMQLKLYNEMMKKNRDIREFRHDYKNNLFSLETFIENEKYDDAKKYIEDLNGSLETTKNRFVTGNYLADAIITDKADNATGGNIEIDFSGTIPESGISNSDLCTVLSNSLDNAVRACINIAPCKIIITSKENPKGVIMKIKNPVEEKVEIKNNKIKTTKADKENHGMGIENIKKVAAKYGGYVELSCDDKFFETEIGLYFKNSEE